MNLFSDKTKSIYPAVFNRILSEVQMKFGLILNRLDKVDVLRINIRLKESFVPMWKSKIRKIELLCCHNNKTDIFLNDLLKKINSIFRSNMKV